MIVQRFLAGAAITLALGTLLTPAHAGPECEFALIDAPRVGDTVLYGQINMGGRSGPIMARTQVLY